MIERIGSKREVRSAVAEARREGLTVGFVPTMGALHEGHLSLVRAACARTDFVVVSVFVNPMQFGPGEDFARYPRDLEGDIQMLAAEDVELVFTPTTATMYGADSQASIDPGPVASRWEGELRPGHFGGVATVVAKLLNIVEADLAFFGEKDYQQLKVIQRLVRDLDFRTTPVGCPIVRDPDGLALSSRNRYLGPAERSAALSIPGALEAASQALAWGTTDARELETVMRDTVAEAGGSVELDYASVVDPETLEPLERVTAPARALIAARVGATRLIDNCQLTPVGVPNAD